MSTNMARSAANLSLPYRKIHKMSTFDARLHFINTRDKLLSYIFCMMPKNEASYDVYGCDLQAF